MRILLVIALLAQSAWGQAISLRFERTPLRQALQAIANSMRLKLEMLEDLEGTATGSYLAVPPEAILRRVLAQQAAPLAYRVAGTRLVVGTEELLQLHQPLEVPREVQELQAGARDRLSLCVSLGEEVFFLEFFTDGTKAGWMHGLASPYNPLCGFARTYRLYAGDGLPVPAFQSLQAAFEEICWTADLPPQRHPEPGVCLFRSNERWLAARIDANPQMVDLVRRVFGMLEPGNRMKLQREFLRRGRPYRGLAGLLGD